MKTVGGNGVASIQKGSQPIYSLENEHGLGHTFDSYMYRKGSTLKSSHLMLHCFSMTGACMYACGRASACVCACGW